MTTTAPEPGGQPLAPVARPILVHAHELPRRPVRRPFGPLAFLVGVLFVAAAAFYAGVVVEKHHVPASSARGVSSASRAATATTATTAVGARTGIGGGAGGGVQGTITLINGDTIYVTGSNGTVTKVQTTAESQITKTTTSAVPVGSLSIGDTVVVGGTTGANGTVQATSVRDLGASGTRTTTPSGSSTTVASGPGGGEFGFGPPPGS